MLINNTNNLDNWRTQLRKGYLELCILLLIQKHGRLYGFELLERLQGMNLSLKEGTLYPLLNRMTQDRLLSTQWETEGLKGHPRKFYSLTEQGATLVSEMSLEFEKLIHIFNQVQSTNQTTTQIQKNIQKNIGGHA